MTDTLESWLKRGGHLPAPLKDFHDAKLLFKTMHARMGKNMDGVGPVFQAPSWIDGQIYTVDFFLHFMARRGWTLQRSRAKVPFRDLGADLKACEEAAAQQFAALLASATPAVSQQEQGE